MTMLSTRNCVSTSEPRAPTAMRMPISRVRSVTERTREIGIRMAIGARGSDVLTQFLVESIVMSLLGGVVGLAVGFGGAALLAHFTGWSVATPLSAVFLAVGFSAAVGVFFGYYPARKAARLNPIQALRYE